MKKKSKAAANFVAQSKNRSAHHFGITDKQIPFSFEDNRNFPGRRTTHRKSKIHLGNNTIQRVLRVNNLTWSHLRFINRIHHYFPGALRAVERARIREWSQSPDPFTFSTRSRRHTRRQMWERIKNNLRHTTATTNEPTIGMSDIPAIFGDWNYEHDTLDTARGLPTLYFDTNSRTGRLRQQHGTGPLAKVDTHRKVRLGMSTLEDRNRVRRAMDRRNFNPLNVRYWRGLRRRRVPVHIPPQHDDFQIEYNMGTAPATGVHISGGRVDRSQNYTQNDINGIYRRIVGI